MVEVIKLKIGAHYTNEGEEPIFGEYVKHSDYLVLESEFDALKAKLDKAVDGLTQITLMLSMHTEGGSEDLGQAKSRASETLAEIGKG
jgi:hypothetical protein